MASLFDRLTPVEPVAGASHTYRATIDEAWRNIFGAAPLGGLLLALVVKATLHCYNEGDGKELKAKGTELRPSTMTINYLEGPKLGETVEIALDLDKTGRSLAFSRCTIRSLSTPPKIYLTGSALYTSLPYTHPEVLLPPWKSTMATESLTLAPASTIPTRPRHKYPVGYNKLFDFRDVDSGETDMWITRNVVKSGVELEVTSEDGEKWARMIDSSPLSWPFLALYTDLFMLSKSYTEFMSSYQQSGTLRTIATATLTITFIRLPDAQEDKEWIRQKLLTTVRSGQLWENRLVVWPKSGGVPLAMGRQISYWNDVKVKPAGKM